MDELTLNSNNFAHKIQEMITKCPGPLLIFIRYYKIPFSQYKLQIECINENYSKASSSKYLKILCSSKKCSSNHVW